MVKSIFLQDGEEIFVDDEDYERVNQYTWWKVFRKNTRVIVTLIDNKEISLTNFIKKGSYQIKKNNYFTGSNLTQEGNAVNWRRSVNGSTSKYKGVYWKKSRNRWFAQLNFNGKRYYLGSSKSEKEAAILYNNGVRDIANGIGFLNDIESDNRIPNKNYQTKKHFNVKRNKTNYHGITPKSKNNKIYYIARKIYKGKRVFLGSSKNKHKAALIYNKCVLYLFGDDAILNDVPMTDELKEFISSWEIPKRIKTLKVGDVVE